MENKLFPLVSIIIITYNSSKYVLETLESAKAQTYQNIELIISDDCSKDDTVEVCRKWLDKNSSRFVRTELVTAEKNTGIAPNCNRGVKKSNGEWLRLIAGDDVLLDDCVENNYKCILHNHCSLVYSKEIEYNDATKEKKFNEWSSNFGQLSIKKQYIQILKNFRTSSTTYFINRAALDSIGGYDEKYPFMEDYPLVYRFLKNGHKLFEMNEYTVLKRIHSSNISKTNFSDGTYISPKLFESSFSFYRNEIRKELFKKFFILELVDKEILFYIKKKILDRGNLTDSYSFDLKLLNMIRPQIWIRKFKKKCHF